MIRVMSIFGTRPEAIKMAPVIHALEENPNCESIVCVTAQHRDMLDQVMELFEIDADEDLDLMLPGQNLLDLTARALQGLRQILVKHTPDVILVHGDTTTSLCGSLAGFYSQIPVGHVEAGLRTGDLKAPFPEEGNRVLTDAISTFHFAPTSKAAENIKKENISDKHTYVTGNTVIDALLWMKNRLQSRSFKAVYANANFLFEEEHLDRKIILITGHRRESFGDGFLRICTAIQQLAERNPEIHLVYPVHLNPNVQKPVYDLLSDFDNIHLIPPLDYEDFVRLMDRSYIILTDSGGIQEEAPSLNKPTLVMREKTERPEGIAAGVVKLVGTSTEGIFEHTQHLIDDTDAYTNMQLAQNPYGDGTASKQIVQALIAHFTGDERDS